MLQCTAVVGFRSSLESLRALQTPLVVEKYRHLSRCQIALRKSILIWMVYDKIVYKSSIYIENAIIGCSWYILQCTSVVGFRSSLESLRALQTPLVVEKYRHLSHCQIALRKGGIQKLRWRDEVGRWFFKCQLYLISLFRKNVNRK